MPTAAMVSVRENATLTSQMTQSASGVSVEVCSTSEMQVTSIDTTNITPVPQVQPERANFTLEFADPELQQLIRPVYNMSNCVVNIYQK